MSEIGATAIPGTIVGADSTSEAALTGPIVEVVMGGDLAPPPADAGPRLRSADRMASILAAKAKPAETPPPAADAPVEDAPPDAEAPPGDATEEAAPDGDKPAEEPPPEVEPAKVDPVADVVAAAELEATRGELAILRQRLGSAGAPSDDDRVAYVDKPLDALRSFVAQRLGLKPDAKEVADELAFLRQELTTEAIGVDVLGDDRKLQRSQEHTDRRWRLGQQIQAASKETARASEQRTAAVKLVSSVLDAAKADHPHLDYAAAFGEDAAQVALDLWVGEVKAGRIQPTGDDAAIAREALRLADKFYQHRADRIAKIRPVETSHAQATAPTKASASAGQPGQLKQPTSKAPAKPVSTPSTLSARQAAAAPSAKAPSTAQPRVIVDPHSPAARAAKLAVFAAKLDKKG